MQLTGYENRITNQLTSQKQKQKPTRTPTPHTHTNTHQKAVSVTCSPGVYLPPWLQMIIQPTGGGEEYLPVAHTCFNLLDLPKYTSRQVMQDKLLLAIQHSEGFGIV